MNWYLQVLRKYADFDGRARRTEYWMFALFNVIFMLAAMVLDYVFGTITIFYILYVLAVFIPSLAVSVRRLHDVGKSGWMLLVGLIPIIGAIWLLILAVTEGTPGENQYGTNPKEAAFSFEKASPSF